jgi:hypothetical protein
MMLSSEDLEQIAARTLIHYERSAEGYWEGTRDHSVSKNIVALLQYIETPPSFTSSAKRGRSYYREAAIGDVGTQKAMSKS